MSDNNSSQPCSPLSITAGDGFCTLCEALANANADSDTTGGDCAPGSGSDVITFTPKSSKNSLLVLFLGGIPWCAGVIGMPDNPISRGSFYIKVYIAKKSPLKQIQ